MDESVFVVFQHNMIVPRVLVTGGVENVVLNVLVFVTGSFTAEMVALVNVKEFEASEQIIYRVGFGVSVD